MGFVDPRLAELVGWVRAAFPDVPWRKCEFRFGAFHHILLSEDGFVVRVAHGDDHASRCVRERATLLAVQDLELGVQLPQVLSDTVTHSSQTGYVLSRVAGSELAPGTWAERRTSYEKILATLAMAPTDLDLPPARTWCGGSGLHAIVANELSLFLGDRAPFAVGLIEQMLSLPPPAAATLVHGDFGHHNVLWEKGQGVSLIDVDHACVDDPAIDLAPLIGAHGVTAVGEITDSDMLHRAMVHRATLSVQVAAAAHLVGNDQLRDHALGNFNQRYEAGTLYDPRGATP